VNTVWRSVHRLEVAVVVTVTEPMNGVRTVAMAIM